MPQEHRGIANAVVVTGMSLGPAVGTYACGLSMARFGWRPVFIFVGLVSLVWVLPYLRYMPEHAHVTRAQPRRLASTMDILRRRNFWATSAGHFCSNYPFYFIIVWLPLYLVHERHLTMKQMAGKATLYYLAFAAIAPLAGWVADKLHSRRPRRQHRAQDRHGDGPRVDRRSAFCWPALPTAVSG